jgi:hypothetical protein
VQRGPSAAHVVVSVRQKRAGGCAEALWVLRLSCLRAGRLAWLRWPLMGAAFRLSRARMLYRAIHAGDPARAHFVDTRSGQPGLLRATPINPLE